MKPDLNEALILNVDDTDAARYARTRILTRAGFRVIEAASGGEALALARQEMPNLVLLDIKLPDINGFEVCRRLKEDDATHPILVLQTSASYIASADKIRALEGGADNYLFEPIEPEELVANVRALLRLGRVERELREADRRKDVFLATLAHELRNPLAPIRTAVELLRKLDPSVPPPQERARQIILRQTDHMIRLVDDLLDVSRITSGKIELRRERIGLRAVLSTAVDSIAPIVQERGHTLTVELPDPDLWIDGDSVRLAQVIGNLLHNAAKFTPQNGHITLSACKTEGPGGAQAEITVSDSGIGLDAGDLHAIFDMFVQRTPAPGRAHDGLGIGLSLAQGLVELHGGQISATSSGKNQGTSFVVHLPLAAKAPAAEDRTQGASILAGATRRVLVIDDNVDSAEMLSALLELQGFATASGHSGQEALDKLTSFNPDIAILDIGLPDMSGFELATCIRALPGGTALRLVALTGYGKQEDKERALAAGFDAHLTKPVGIEALVAALEGGAGRPTPS